MANKPSKRCSTSYVIREMEIKTAVRCHYTTIRTAKTRALTPPNAGEDGEQQELSSLLVGTQNAAATLAVSDKTKHPLTVQPRNCTLKHLSQRNETLYSHKNLYVNVYSNFIHNNPKWKLPQRPSVGE